MPIATGILMDNGVRAASRANRTSNVKSAFGPLPDTTTRSRHHGADIHSRPCTPAARCTRSRRTPCPGGATRPCPISRRARYTNASASLAHAGMSMSLYTRRFQAWWWTAAAVPFFWSNAVRSLTFLAPWLMSRSSDVEQRSPSVLERYLSRDRKPRHAGVDRNLKAPSCFALARRHGWRRLGSARLDS